MNAGRIHRKTRGFVAIVIATLMLPGVAWTCLCSNPWAYLSGEFDHRSAVFVGIAESVTRRPPERIALPGTSVETWGPPMIDIQFRVLRSWKGVPEDTTATLRTWEGVHSGYFFESGGRYLVFADEFRGQLRTGKCTRTAAFPSAVQDSLALESLNSPD